jgi:tRNA pseudouridine13 synthase
VADGFTKSAAPLPGDDPLLQHNALWDDLPCAWGGAVGSGRIRTAPEDFRVVEVASVVPAGAGEHSWLYVRKRGSNTQWVARELARHAQVPLSAVSYAGLKDRNAVTEQWFSVHLPGRPDPDWETLDSDAFQVLRAVRHSRKLKTGTLRGNRFVVRIRRFDAPREHFERRLQQLAAGGFPNYFGHQRFGHDGSNLAAAAQLLFGRRGRVSRHQRGIYISAVRAALFNRLLAARVADGSWNTALPGAALQLQGKSACFVAEEVDTVLLERLRALEVHPTGPLCGAGDVLACGHAAHYEQDVLQSCGHWIAALQRLRVSAARRALRVVPGDLGCAPDEQGNPVLEFFLPAGAYATSLLREILGPDPVA